MKRKRKFIFPAILLTLLLIGVCANEGVQRRSPLQTEAEGKVLQEEGQKEAQDNSAMNELVTEGSKNYRGFILDNVLHSKTEGDIHYNLYVPESYDGSTPYALFVTLPGYEGLYFQGVGANLRAEEYGFEAQKYNDQMIVAAPQLSDWGEKSANQAIALTEYLLSRYHIDASKVYLHGLSGGGETGSLVMGKRPELYTAYLAASTQWDGDLNVLARAETPVYLAIGEEDSYYGSESLREAYETLHALYREKGLSEDEIREILVLDVKDQAYFVQRGYSDQHAGGLAFAFDEEIMGWLFSR